MDAVRARQSRNHMATTFEFVISCPRGHEALARRALSRAHEEVARLERELSEFLPGSPIHALNHAPPGTPVRLTPDGIRLLAAAERLRERTRGAFDCTAKSRTPLPPGERLRWDEATREVARGDEGVRVGFGAIGKGYALDRARASIESEGFRDYLLSGGGSSLVLSGMAGPNQPWTWAWSWSSEHDEPRGLPFAHTSGATIALGISGTNFKGEHLLDPTTGQAARAEGDSPRSTLVAHPSAAEADALSTALFVAGWERGFETLLGPAAEPAAAMIDADEVPRWNGVFQRLWGAPAQLGAFALFSLAPAVARAQEQANLSALGLNDFTPYVFERNGAWMALPAFAIGVVLLHVLRPKKNFRKPIKPNIKGETR